MPSAICCVVSLSASFWAIAMRTSACSYASLCGASGSCCHVVSARHSQRKLFGLTSTTLCRLSYISTTRSSCEYEHCILHHKHVYMHLCPIHTAKTSTTLGVLKGLSHPWWGEARLSKHAELTVDDSPSQMVMKPNRCRQHSPRAAPPPPPPHVAMQLRSCVLIEASTTASAPPNAARPSEATISAGLHKA